MRRCVLGIAAVALLGGCRGSEVQRCLDLNAKEQYEQAAQLCAAAFAAGNDPRAAEALVRAKYSLGQQDEVLAWAQRLEKSGKATPAVWGMAAAVHQERGEIEKAERANRRDLELSRAAGDHARASAVLYRLFYLSWGQSNRFRDTFLLARDALQEATAAQDRRLQAKSAQALYTVLYEIGDTEGARRALEASETALDEQDHAGRARFLNNLGTVLAAEGRPALARRNFEQALELGAGLEEEFFRGVHLNLTEVNLDLGEIERAAYYLEEAWGHAEADQPLPASFYCYRARVALARGKLAEAARSLAAGLKAEPEPEWAWQLEYQQGRLAEAQGDFDGAEAAYRRSIAIVEEMRRSLVFDELKSWLLDEKRQPFEALFRLQARSGRSMEALATAERAQARTFLDAFLHASSGTVTAPGKPWSNVSLQRIEGLESLLPAMSESPVAALQPIDRVLAALSGRHGLVYFEAGDDLWLITVGDGRIDLRALAPAKEIRRLAGRFLADPEEGQTARLLGKALLPEGSLPEKGQTLHVVADGLLGNLPLAALRHEGRYLVEDYPIVFVPSLSALTALEGPAEKTFRPPLVLADPLGNLPAAAAEGLQVAKLLGGTPLTGAQAVSGNLERASGARALHLAMHTGLGPSGAWLGLADRQVTASEIVTGRIGPRLVVLASCSSGVRPGRQMWGSLGAAFLAAGSRAVLASLWSIEDEPARSLVLDFYRLGGASDPSGALARAQRVAIRQGVSPKHWAPFLLFGSGRPLSEAWPFKGGKT